MGCLHSSSTSLRVGSNVVRLRSGLAPPQDTPSPSSDPNIVLPKRAHKKSRKVSHLLVHLGQQRKLRLEQRMRRRRRCRSGLRAASLGAGGHHDTSREFANFFSSELGAGCPGGEDVPTDEEGRSQGFSWDCNMHPCSSVPTLLVTAEHPPPM